MPYASLQIRKFLTAIAQEALLYLVIFFVSCDASAESWHSGLQGDPRSVGRGGTGVVLSDDFWGVIENPAGSALTVGGSQLQFSNNAIMDSEQFALGQVLKVNSGGVVAPQTPWGFAAGYSSSNQVATVREYSASASRLFFDERLSLGVALNYGNSIIGDQVPPDGAAWGTTLGALIRLPKRVLLGATFKSAMTYAEGDGSRFIHPWSLGLGVGQIPNRFFRFEAGLRFLGSSVPSDASLNLQPHLGLEYGFVDLRQIQIRLFSGSYLETNRIHGTIGIGTDPWIFSVSASVDYARGYQNFLFAFGIDLGRVLKKLRIMPSSVPAPAGGIFPGPFEVSDDWLPPRLQDDPENSFQEIGPSPERAIRRLEDPKRIGTDQPKALESEKNSFIEDLEDLKSEFK